MTHDNAASLLYDLGALGVLLLVRDQQLRFWPAAAVDEEMISRMKRHKTQLIQLITEESEPVE